MVGVNPTPDRGLNLSFTFPLQLIPISQELQGVRLIWGFNVIHVNVQIIGGVQEVIRQDGALAVVQ